MYIQSYTQKSTHTNSFGPLFFPENKKDTEDYWGQFRSIRANRKSLHWPKSRDLEYGRKLLKLIKTHQTYFKSSDFINKRRKRDERN